MVSKIKDYEFQTQCVEFLIEKTVETTSKQVITVKAPTGAGKTIILIKYVDEFLKNTAGNTAFVWLCPGKGNLEEQSKARMEEVTPYIDTRNLMYSMMAGFEPGDLVAFYLGNKILVKRCIAGPGQWVDIDESGNVSVDGRLLEEPYLTEKALGECDIALPYQVPDNRYFCVGDHRSTSVDSRSTAVGCISDEQIVGRIVFRVWPLPDFGALK